MMCRLLVGLAKAVPGQGFIVRSMLISSTGSIVAGDRPVNGLIGMLDSGE
jgi:hypothetical protein